MTRHDFLAAVAAAPDDDTPRLAFADYLEDEGDADWADLIRLQVGFFRDWSNFDEMNRREKALIVASADRFPNPAGCELGPPVRGFPMVLTVKYDLDPDYAAAFRWPIRWLRTPYVLPAFPQQQFFPQLEVLELLDIVFRDIDDGVRLGDFNDLAHCRPDQLKALFWRNARLPDWAVSIIAAEPTLAGLRELDLSGNNFTDEAAARLAESPFLGNLEYLNLAGNPILSTNRLERRFGAALRMV